MGDGCDSKAALSATISQTFGAMIRPRLMAAGTPLMRLCVINKDGQKNTTRETWFNASLQPATAARLIVPPPAASGAAKGRALIHAFLCS